MAQQVTATARQTGHRRALNVAHSLTYTGQVHNDGPEWSNADTPVEQVIFSAQPSKSHRGVRLLGRGQDVVEPSPRLRGCQPSDHIFAHKGGRWGEHPHFVCVRLCDVYAAARTALILLLNDLYTQYENHRKNSGGTWHTAVDTENYIGTSLTITGSAPDRSSWSGWTCSRRWSMTMWC